MAKKFVLSEEQREWFVANYATALIKEMEDYLHCSKVTVYKLGKELGLERPYVCSAKVELTERQKKYLINHFKNTKNDELMAHLGLKFATFHRYVRKLGLTKTKQFMSKCQTEAKDAAFRSNMIHGTFPPKGFRVPRREENYFKSGVTPEMRLGKRKNRLRIEKLVASRKATMRKEHARITFGLPQKTKLRMVCQSREKVSFRYNLKKHGYIIDDDLRIAFYNEQTCRSKIMENREQKWFTFEPLNENIERS